MTRRHRWHVRPARPEEAPALVEAQLAMARESEQLELDVETVRRGVAAVFGDPAKGRYWIAEESDGSGEGFAGCLLVTPEWSDWRNGTVLWIQSVYVRPELRRRGVYRSLWETLKSRVEAEPGLKGIRLYVDRRNAVASHAYERLGMSREHYELFEWLAPER